MLEIAVEAVEIIAIGYLVWSSRRQRDAVVEIHQVIDRRAQQFQRWHKRLSRNLNEHVSSNLHRR